MSQTYFQDIFVGCEQQHQFQITSCRIASKSHAHSFRLISKSSLISLTIFFVSLSLPLHFGCLPHPLLQTHTGRRWCYTLWAWWTYTSEIRALRQSLELPDTLGWVDCLTDWLTLLDGRLKLLFWSHCIETHSWVLQLWAFKGEEIVVSTNKIHLLLLLWNVTPPSGLTKLIISNCRLVPFAFSFRHPTSLREWIVWAVAQKSLNPQQQDDAKASMALTKMLVSPTVIYLYIYSDVSTLVLFLLIHATLYILQDMQHSLLDVKLMRTTIRKPWYQICQHKILY